MSTFIDDRTEAQKQTHPIIIVGTDSFMSGWGGARGGASYAGWACKREDMYTIERWVRNRSEMKRVRIVGTGYRPSAAHTHIYFVGENHPALGKRN